MPFWSKKNQNEVEVPDPEEGRGPSSAYLQADPGHVKSAAEKRYLYKLDVCLLLFCCISQIIKYIDQQNINFAYTAGMQQDLNLYGNELNLFTTYFNVGYCIFIIPSQIMITWFRPALYLSSLELIWGVLTFCYAATHNASQVYAIRALVGIAESSAYPGAITLLMSWYTPTELAKRVGFYSASQAMGGLMASALQSAIYKTLNGAHGIAGWRWGFIINGIMTVVVAVAGLFFVPDYPDRPNRWAFWLTKDDCAMATERLTRWRRKSPKKVNLQTAKKVALNPMTYHLAVLYIGFLLSGYGSNYFNLFLKSLKGPDGKAVWSTAMLSAVPIGGYAINIALSFGLSYISDMFQTRWLILLGLAIVGFPPLVILCVWNVPVGALYYAYFMLYVLQTASPLVWAWMSDMLPRDPEQRSMIIGVCIALYYATNAWANPLIYPASEAPHYKRGWFAVLALLIFSALTIISLRIYDVKVARPRNYQMAIEAEEAQRQAHEAHAAQMVAEADGQDAKNGALTVVVPRLSAEEARSH
ncbi:hypothetical protein JCM24511_02560 [Saitozyma sp. JCM 24511]|nr:hypothetical protein JCM24511_02560 [Saitozyma sp. JCM 24511]